MNEGPPAQSGHGADQSDRQRSVIITMSIHLILLLCLLFPIIQSQSESIVVESYLIVDYSNQLHPQQKQNTSSASSSSRKKATHKPARIQQPKQQSKTPAAAKKPEAAKREQQAIGKSVATPAAVRAELTDPNTDAIRAATDKANQARAARAAEAKKAAEAEAAYAQAKSEFSSLFHPGSDQSAETDEGIAEGIIDGGGEQANQADTGLAGRELLYAPKISDDTQATGIIVISLCVGRDGRVTSTRYTQKGSTSSDRSLVEAAMAAISQYQFSKSESNKQCGELSIDFKLK